MAQAAAGDLTFQSIYKEDNTVFWVGAALAALVAGAVVLYSAGTATPLLSSIGSWIGGLMGYSGVAATNAGLAWLGGGSLAAGGYGMAGGAALLTAIFTFSTEVVVDAAITDRHDAYNYSQFTAQTQMMVTLPLPRNERGPKSVEAAFKVLHEIDEDANLRDPQVQLEIERALAEVKNTHEDSISAAESARKETFTAILELILGKAKEARASAAKAYGLAEKEKIARTMPAFLLAVTELHEELPDLTTADAYLKYAINGERDNPLVPLLVKMYADRLTARISAGSLTPPSVAGVIQVIAGQPDDKRLAMSYGIMQGELFSAIKIEQQHLLYLLRTENEKLRTSPGTVDEASALLSNFRSLLDQADQLLTDGSEGISRQLDDGTFSVTPAWAKSWAVEWFKAHALLESYHSEVPELIAELEEFKTRIRAMHAGSQAPMAIFENSWSWILLLGGFLLAAGFGGGVAYQRRRVIANKLQSAGEQK